MIAFWYMFLKYSVTVLLSVTLLCPFPVKMLFKKFIFLGKYFFVYILYAS